MSNNAKGELPCAPRIVILSQLWFVFTCAEKTRDSCTLEEHVQLKIVHNSASDKGAVLAPGELVAELINDAPVGDCYQFPRVEGCFDKTGIYCLEYSLEPAGSLPVELKHRVNIKINPGATSRFELQVRMYISCCIT